MPSLNTPGTRGNDPVAAQREYYRITAEQYDSMHTDEFDEHYVALKHIVHYLRWVDARTVLDTGCGTGRAMRYLMQEAPDLELHGNDPSADLLRIAAERHDIEPGRLDCVGSDKLPYPDAHFDAVIETGMLHHVPRPEVIIREMLRVSRKAVFISDCNIYGMGSVPYRLAKLGLARLGLLRGFNRIRRGGKEWYYGDGDGVGWSYSAFDSLEAIRENCAEVIVIPTQRDDGFSAAVPLLASATVLVAGFKQPLSEHRA